MINKKILFCLFVIFIFLSIIGVYDFMNQQDEKTQYIQIETGNIDIKNENIIGDTSSQQYLDSKYSSTGSTGGGNTF